MHLKQDSFKNDELHHEVLVTNEKGFSVSLKRGRLKNILIKSQYR